ncbi:unnamed protein product [Paramecium sonneborni]|uniref:Uncharacterized protein n=1 Tax=Paramecium sonneborni TaxID=65129 RepID=A0A8S1MV50_9CILI|nr:unnamed protein product [Paramecium sonneborni]
MVLKKRNSDQIFWDYNLHHPSNLDTLAQKSLRVLVSISTQDNKNVIQNRLINNDFLYLSNSKRFKQIRQQNTRRFLFYNVAQYITDF